MANEEVIAAVRERLSSLLAGGSSESHPTRDQVVDRPVVQEDGAASPGAPVPQAIEPSRPPEDWSGTLDAVYRAAEVLRAREERIRALETELNQVREESAESVAALQAHAASLLEQLANMDERRARAEEWLLRLHSAIAERLSPHKTVQDESSRLVG